MIKDIREVKNLDREVTLTMNLKDLIFIYASVGACSTSDRAGTYSSLGVDREEIEKECSKMSNFYNDSVYSSLEKILSGYGIGVI